MLIKTQLCDYVAPCLLFPVFILHLLLFCYLLSTFFSFPLLHFLLFFLIPPRPPLFPFFEPQHPHSPLPASLRSHNPTFSSYSDPLLIACSPLIPPIPPRCLPPLFTVVCSPRFIFLLLPLLNILLLHLFTSFLIFHFLFFFLFLVLFILLIPIPFLFSSPSPLFFLCCSSSSPHPDLLILLLVRYVLLWIILSLFLLPICSFQVSSLFPLSLSHSSLHHPPLPLLPSSSCPCCLFLRPMLFPFGKSSNPVEFSCSHNPDIELPRAQLRRCIIPFVFHATLNRCTLNRLNMFSVDWTYLLKPTLPSRNCTMQATLWRKQRKCMSKSDTGTIRHFQVCEFGSKIS